MPSSGRELPIQATEKVSGIRPRRFLPGIYGLVWTAWICTGCLPVVLQVQHERGVQHFAPLPFLLPFVLTLVCTLIGLVFGLWRIVRGPHRRTGVILSAIALVPLAFWTIVGSYAYTSWTRRQKPNTFLMQVARRGAASVMDAELFVRYPHRIERRHFTMFYQNIGSPEKDADKMDAYLTELEQRCHRSVRVPIYWVRGRLLGQGSISDYGLALGSARSTPPVVVEGRAFDDLDDLDRHEVAHAVMHQWQTPQSDPPTFFEEGWAEANGNLHMNFTDAADELIGLERAQQAPQRGRMLVSLLRADTYYRDDGEIYPCGAYVATYLIKKYGFDRFLRLYNEIRPQTAVKDIERILGIDLPTLENEMWQEADRLTAVHPG